MAFSFLITGVPNEWDAQLISDLINSSSEELSFAKLWISVSCDFLHGARCFFVSNDLSNENTHMWGNLEKRMYRLEDYVKDLYSGHEFFDLKEKKFKVLDFKVVPFYDLGELINFVK